MLPAPPPVVDAAFYDTECSPNYWLLKFRPRGCGALSFRLRAGEAFTHAQSAQMRALFAAYRTVSFNGNGYDVPMINAAISGYTCEQLKWLNDQIIVEGLKPWQLGLPEWSPADHIDVMEVAPGAGSQKQYAGRIHCKTMRDLPYSPDHYLSEPEIVEVDDYCENDLAVLESLYDALRPQLQQREALSARYGIDLRSKSDAQVAEAVLKLRCQLATGRRIYKPEIDWNLRFQYRIPDFISYQLPQLQRALGLVRESVFSLGATGSVVMPPQLEGLEITIGQSTYKIGIGGLHSQEKRIVHRSDDQWVLRDNDVASYYPSLILNSGEWPPALGQTFQKEYGTIKSDRLHAKREGAKLRKQLVLLEKELLDAKAGTPLSQAQ